MGSPQSEELFAQRPGHREGAEGLERKQVPDLAPVPGKDCIGVHFTFASCICSVVAFVFFHVKSVRDHSSLKRVVSPGQSALKFPCRVPWIGRRPELPQNAKEMTLGSSQPRSQALNPKPCLRGIRGPGLCTG